MRGKGGAVGSLDHVLGKIFSDLASDENLKQIENESSLKRLNNKNADGTDNGDIVGEMNEDNFDESKEIEVQKDISEEKEDIIGNDGSDENPETQSNGEITEDNPTELNMIVLEPNFAIRMEEIQLNLEEKRKYADELETYLSEQREKSHTANEIDKQKLYEMGLLPGAEIPARHLHVDINQECLEKYSIFCPSIMIASQIMNRDSRTEVDHSKFNQSRSMEDNNASKKSRAKKPNTMSLEEQLAISEMQEEEEWENRQMGDAQKKKTAPLPTKKKETEKLKSHEYEENMERLKKMKDRISFLKNPRLVKADIKQQQGEGFRESIFYGVNHINKTEREIESKFSDGVVPFIEVFQIQQNEQVTCPIHVEPNYARFSDYQIGQTYYGKVSLYNSGKVLSSVRILPPTTKYFAISKIEHPSGSSLIAPGMACHIEIMFCPDSEGTYDDFITVITETEKFRVVLLAQRDPPMLTLPKDLWVDAAFLGNETIATFTCKNTGGAGGFQLLAANEWPNVPVDVVSQRDVLTLGSFSIEPVNFKLNTGESIDIQIRFIPSQAGEECIEFPILCDNAQVRFFKVRGIGCMVDVFQTELDGVVLDVENPYVSETKSLKFSPTTVGSRSNRKITYRNNAALDIAYEWEIDGEESAFSISPSTGMIPKYSEMSFAIEYAPLSFQAHEALSRLVVRDVPAIAVDANQIVDLAERHGIAIRQVELQGKPVSPSVHMEPAALLPGPLFTNQTQTMKFQIQNATDAETCFEFREVTDGCASMKFEPESGCLGPQGCADVIVKISGKAPGNYFINIPCILSIPNVDDLNTTESVSFMGSVHEPHLQVSAKNIDFGLLKVSETRVRKFTIKNPSPVPIEARIKELLQGVTSDEQATLSIEPESCVLHAGEEVMVSITCHASKHPERLRRICKTTTSFGGEHFLRVGGEIQTPMVFLQTDDNNLMFDLGTTYTTVPVAKHVKLVNGTNLETPFVWTELNQQTENYTITCNPQNGVLGPKESLDVTLTFEAFQPCRVNSMLHCEIQGMFHMIGCGIKTQARGLVVEYSLLTDSQETKAEEEGDAALKAEASSTGSKLPVLNFGDEVELCKRKILRLSIANCSAIPAEYSLSVTDFAANWSPPPIGGGTQSSRFTLESGNSRSTKPSGPRSVATMSVFSSSSQKGTRRIRLSDSHERTSVYRSKAGKEHVNAKLALEEDRDILSNGQGVAFIVNPPEGVLEPWSNTTIEVICCSNMPGKYRSELVCHVGSLAPVLLPIKVQITGSPIEILNRTVGLTVKSSSESVPYSIKNPHGKLRFGHALVGTEAVHKTIKVANNGPIPTRLSWRTIAARASDAPLVESSISTQVPENENSKPVAFQIRPHPSLSILPPFTMEPASDIIPPYSTGNFRVLYHPQVEEASQDNAYAVANCEWVDQDAQDENEESKIGGTATVTSSTTGTSVVGGVKREPIMNAVIVSLDAHSIKPSLSLNKARRGINDQHFLGFVVWSVHKPDHQSYFKTLTFTNANPTPQSCTISLSAPFAIADLQVSTTSKLRQSRDLDKKPESENGMQAKVNLPPGAILALTVQFKPDGLAPVSDDINERLRRTVTGLLDIQFSNGFRQSVNLEGTIVEPMVTALPSFFDFGVIHVEQSQSTLIRLGNPSVVPATWKIVHVPEAVEGFVDDREAWSFDTMEGVLIGPTIPLTSSHARMPQGFDKGGIRQPGTINACFAPSTQSRYQSKFRMKVQNGASFDIVLRGDGSYYEENDSSVKWLPNAGQ